MKTGNQGPVQVPKPPVSQQGGSKHEEEEEDEDEDKGGKGKPPQQSGQQQKGPPASSGGSQGSVSMPKPYPPQPVSQQGKDEDKDEEEYKGGKGKGGPSSSGQQDKKRPHPGPTASQQPFGGKDSRPQDGDGSDYKPGSGDDQAKPCYAVAYTSDLNSIFSASNFANCRVGTVVLLPPQRRYAPAFYTWASSNVSDINVFYLILMNNDEGKSGKRPRVVLTGDGSVRSGAMNARNLVFSGQNMTGTPFVSSLASQLFDGVDFINFTQPIINITSGSGAKATRSYFSASPDAAEPFPLVNVLHGSFHCESCVFKGFKVRSHLHCLRCYTAAILRMRGGGEEHIEQALPCLERGYDYYVDHSSTS
jgi:hypothetical protein